VHACVLACVRARAVRALAQLMGNCIPTHDDEDDEDEGSYISLTHVRQSYSWDCGLACVMMVLQHKGMSAPLEEMMKIAGTKSVWTVDLAYILSRYGVDFTFYTVTDGVRPEYGTEAFYKLDIDADMVRVNKLFETAPQLNITIDKRSVDVSEILECVQRGGMVITLVDKRLLPTGSTIARLIHQQLAAGFVGHYVIVCGHNPRTRCVLITDPACGDGRTAVPIAEYEAARKAFGTDEDLLLIAPGRGNANNRRAGPAAAIAAIAAAPPTAEMTGSPNGSAAGA
jgi:hypothetical protein